MLIVTRKIGQSIQVGDHILVCVSEIDGNQVKIAIDAPKDVKILRSELTKKPQSYLHINQS